MRNSYRRIVSMSLHFWRHVLLDSYQSHFQALPSSHILSARVLAAGRISTRRILVSWLLQSPCQVVDSFRPCARIPSQAFDFASGQFNERSQQMASISDHYCSQAAISLSTKEPSPFAKLVAPTDPSTQELPNWSSTGRWQRPSARMLRAQKDRRRIQDERSRLSAEDFIEVLKDGVCDVTHSLRVIDGAKMRLPKLVATVRCTHYARGGHPAFKILNGLLHGCVSRECNVNDPEIYFYKAITN